MLTILFLEGKSLFILRASQVIPRELWDQVTSAGLEHGLFSGGNSALVNQAVVEVLAVAADNWLEAGLIFYKMVIFNVYLCIYPLIMLVFLAACWTPSPAGTSSTPASPKPRSYWTPPGPQLWTNHPSAAACLQPLKHSSHSGASLAVI